MIPDDLLFTEKHEWVRIEGDTATVGISDYARNQLGDIVYVELPETGVKVSRMNPFGTIEAVKAVSDLYAPVSGEVVAVNDEIPADPTAIKNSPSLKGLPSSLLSAASLVTTTPGVLMGGSASRRFFQASFSASAVFCATDSAV